MSILLGILAFVFITHIRDVLSVCKAVSAGNNRDAIREYVLLWLVVPASITPALIAAYTRSAKTGLLWGGGSLALVVATAFVPPQVQYLYLMVPFAGIAYLMIRRWRDGWPVDGAIAASLFAIVLTCAAKVRHLTLSALLRSPLDPDAMGYQLISQRPFGYATEFREPGYIWALKLTRIFSTGDYSDPAMRLYACLFSFFALGVLFLSAYRLFGLLVAFCASLLFACSYELAMDAVRVLREDLIIASVLAYLYFYWAYWRKPIRWQHYLLLGIIAAAGTLLRLHGITFYVLSLLVHFGVSWWTNGRALRQSWVAALAIAALAIPVAPYLVYCSKTYNNAMFINDIGMRFYANFELAGVDPRFPTKAEVNKDAYAGGPMKTGEFLFKYHTVGQVVKGSLAGMVRLYSGDLAQYAFKPFFDLDRQLLRTLVVLSLAGTVGLMFSTAGRIVFILLFLFHAPSFYLVQFKWFDPRLLTAAFVGFYIAAGVALTYTIAGARRLLAMASGTNTSTAHSRSKETLPLQRKPRAIGRSKK